MQKRKREKRKIQTREKVLKSKKGKDSTNLDFEAESISGTMKTPMGSLIDRTRSDKNFDFVKIRLRWHPEMIESAYMLEGS